MELPAAARFCMVAVWAASRQLLLPSLAWSKRKLWSRRYVPSKRLEIREPRSLGSTANGVRFAAELHPGPDNRNRRTPSRSSAQSPAMKRAPDATITVRISTIPAYYS
jgi:hypothetical protein